MPGNPFQDVPDVPDPEEFIDIVHRRVERAAENQRKAFRGTRADDLTRARTIELVRINTACQMVQDRLWEIVRRTPNLDELHPFYRELVEVVAGVDRMKEALASVHKVAKLARLIREEYGERVKRARDPREAAEVRRQALGRLYSAVRRKAGDAMRYLRRVTPKLKEFPSIDPDVFTVVVAGCPNVGKTTLMSAITGSRPRIASYPFTTKGIQVGYTEDPYPIQVLDTPGLLDRDPETMNEIERKALAALEHVADAVLYLIDPTETCGYPLDHQLSLLERLEETFPDTPSLVILTKADVEDLWKEPELDGRETLAVSAKTGEGIKELKRRLNDMARGYYRRAGRPG